MIFGFPATTGSWTFTDNLFDQVHFIPAPYAPLVMDYNGYWPVTAADTLCKHRTRPSIRYGRGSRIARHHEWQVNWFRRCRDGTSEEFTSLLRPTAPEYRASDTFESQP